MQIIANLYFWSVSSRRNAHFWKTRFSLERGARPGTLLSRRPILGCVWLERGANFTFWIFVFIFFQKWVWRQAHTLGLWTPLREAILSPNPLFYLRNLMFFFRNHQFYEGNLILFGPGWPLGCLWGPGPLLETVSEFRWSHLWSWKLSGALFGCIWDSFGLLFELFGTLWDHIFWKFGRYFSFASGCKIRNIFLVAFFVSNIFY